MAQAMPKTSQEAMMGILQQIAAAMAAPDANLEQLAELQKSVVASIRAPYDTPSPGSPVGAAMNMGNGAPAPAPGTPAPGELSPMLAAMMANASPAGAPGPAALPPGSMQAGGLATRTPPNMDELRRILTVG